MDGHFAAFSFVDRITDLVPATRARGRFAIPATIDAFPSALVAEATGQLAAWTAMAHIDFRGRPVAALATETRFHGEARPGDLLALEVEIEHCDDETVAYRGSASANGRLVVELLDCLGPMLPLADFDDPATMREQFALLCASGARPGRFPGIAPPALELLDAEAGRARSARLHVPADAPFFADHFPRRPVFPATLLLHAQIALARSLVSEAGRRMAPARMTNVKVRQFTSPGDTLLLTAEIAGEDADGVRIALGARNGERNVASARLLFAEMEVA